MTLCSEVQRRKASTMGRTSRTFPHSQPIWGLRPIEFADYSRKSHPALSASRQESWLFWQLFAYQQSNSPKKYLTQHVVLQCTPHASCPTQPFHISALPILFGSDFRIAVLPTVAEDLTWRPNWIITRLALIVLWAKSSRHVPLKIFRCDLPPIR